MCIENHNFSFTFQDLLLALKCFFHVFPEPDGGTKDPRCHNWAAFKALWGKQCPEFDLTINFTAWFDFCEACQLDKHHNSASSKDRTSEGPLSRKNEGRGVTLVCLVHYPWMRPKLFRDCRRMHFGPRTQRKGTVSHFVALKFTDPVSANSLQSLLGFLPLWNLPNKCWHLNLFKFFTHRRTNTRIGQANKKKTTFRNNKWIKQRKYWVALSSCWCRTETVQA